MSSEDLINFDVIETQKENIRSLPGGRSARSLANLFSPSDSNDLSTQSLSDTKTLQDSVRQEFEEEILLQDESDDPLDIFDRYVKWTLDAFPSAQATPQSQLQPLLERATKTFLSYSHYKNDPRYLKLWLHYIRLFSDSPRETFGFLARHSIGQGLALFYEEFAGLLENSGRWTQAEEIYVLGIQHEARPVERLLRKYSEFRRRCGDRPEGQDGPSSPALPTVRPALAAKVDPFAPSLSGPQDPQSQRPAIAAAGAGGSRKKLEVFSDSVESAEGTFPDDPSSTKGWENIGTMQQRRKENTIEARPWAGETIKGGNKPRKAQKMMVFKDESLSTETPKKNETTVTQHPLHNTHVFNARSGKDEIVFVNLEAIYPNPDNPGEEMSFEELRAKHRAWLSRDWSRPKVTGLKHSDNSEIDPEYLPGQSNSRGLILSTDDETLQSVDVFDDDGPKEVLTDNKPRKHRKMVMEVKSEAQTIQTKLASPTGPKLRRKHSTCSAEPTMTFHTRAATDEIYGIFNQPLKNAQPIAEDEESLAYSDEEDDEEDDATSAAESTSTGRAYAASEIGDDQGGSTGTSRVFATSETDGEEQDAEAKSISEWSEFTARKHIPDVYNPHASVQTPGFSGVGKGPLSNQNGGNFHTPNSTQDCLPLRPRFIPIRPEDVEPPTQPYRDASQISQNRLPFMTPIFEKTESSIETSAENTQKDFTLTKTPSRVKEDDYAFKNLPMIIDFDDGEWKRHLKNRSYEENQMERSDSLIIGETSVLQFPSSSGNGEIQDRCEISASAMKPKPTVIGKIADKEANSCIINDKQCNPHSEEIRNTILENLQPPLSSYLGFNDKRFLANGRSGEIRRNSKAIAKTGRIGSDKTTTNFTVPLSLQFDDSQGAYILKRELGKGAFAPVYLVENTSVVESVDSSQQESRRGNNQPKRRRLEAMKVEAPPSAWEFYIIRQAELRLAQARAAESLIRTFEFHLFKDECFLVEEYLSQGTLLDIVNMAKADTTSTNGGLVDESLVIFFAIELFRVVESLHGSNLMHGDLKVDNCLVRFSTQATTGTDCNELWSPRYCRDGSHGWSCRGLALIDFGKGIDMRSFRPDATFFADWKAESSECIEIREMRPWTWQVDYHGLAGIIHTLLFGKYLETVLVQDDQENDASRCHNQGHDPDQELVGGSKLDGCGSLQRNRSRYRVREHLKRYWQQDIWTEVFDCLLNPLLRVENENNGHMPLLNTLAAIRRKMEDWLEANSERGIGLRNIIRRTENGLNERKR
ncbi:MAG: hypothetical protein M1829_003569 [Trizodia sp. TS-e1964]|nr:MAG: hypothetical protein M1829_003569 [Trizodia sp. TS-e1964]